MMSDIDNLVDETIEGLKKKAEEESFKQEVQKKELLIRARKSDVQLNKILENDKNAELAKTINYGTMSAADIEKTQQENADYMAAARNKMRFMNKSFDDAVPYFRKNLILIGGKTGDGKSTTVANIIRSTIAKPNPLTGKRRRVLVITNEEKVEDVFNRVTCLIKKWDYRNHDKFTEEQVSEFNKYIKHLSKDGMITVIDNTYGGAIGTTTTLEGICQIFDNLIENQEYFDVILIDYYQNVNQSRINPSMGPYEVQDALAKRLDGYKNIYPAPIILLAQVAPPDKDAKTPFKVRIEGRKSILNVATCCLEIVANREELVTEWLIHKSRFNGAVGQKIQTGYKHGEYVEYTDEFKADVARMRERIERDALDKKVGLTAPKAEEE
jgi:hypothetical protein